MAKPVSLFFVSTFAGCFLYLYSCANFWSWKIINICIYSSYIIQYHDYSQLYNFFITYCWFSNRSNWKESIAELFKQCALLSYFFPSSTARVLTKTPRFDAWMIHFAFDFWEKFNLNCFVPLLLLSNSNSTTKSDTTQKSNAQNAAIDHTFFRINCGDKGTIFLPCELSRYLFMTKQFPSGCI